MRDIADIPEIPDRATRLAEVTVDCYGRDEELSWMNLGWPPLSARTQRSMAPKGWH
jgi:hypothetical protein